MDRLLKAVLGRLLSDYIVHSKETGDGEFRARFTSSGICLHDIEFNTQKLPGAGKWLKSATAKSLEFKIPWTSLTSQNIQIFLKQIRLQLASDASDAFETAGNPNATDYGSIQNELEQRLSLSSGSGKGYGLSSVLLRSALSVSIFADDIQIIRGDRMISMQTTIGYAEILDVPFADWKHLIASPRLWLNKAMQLSNVRVVVGKIDSACSLQMNTLRVSILLPISLFVKLQEELENIEIPIALDIGEANVEVEMSFLQQLKSVFSTTPGTINRENIAQSFASKLQALLCARIEDILSRSLDNRQNLSWTVEFGVTLQALDIRLNAPVRDGLSCMQISMNGEELSAGLTIQKSKLESWFDWRQIALEYVWWNNEMEFKSETTPVSNTILFVGHHPGHNYGSGKSSIKFSFEGRNIPWMKCHIRSFDVNLTRCLIFDIIPRLHRCFANLDDSTQPSDNILNTHEAQQQATMQLEFEFLLDKFSIVLSHRRRSLVCSFNDILARQQYGGSSAVVISGRLSWGLEFEEHPVRLLISNESHLVFQKEDGHWSIKMRPHFIQVKNAEYVGHLLQCFEVFIKDLKYVSLFHEIGLESFSVRLDYGEQSGDEIVDIASKATNGDMYFQASITVEATSKCFSTSISVVDLCIYSDICSKRIMLPLFEVCVNGPSHASLVHGVMTKLEMKNEKNKDSLERRKMLVDSVHVTLSLDEISAIQAVSYATYFLEKTALLMQDNAQHKEPEPPFFFESIIKSITLNMTNYDDYQNCCVWVDTMEFKKCAGSEMLKVFDIGIEIEAISSSSYQLFEVFRAEKMLRGDMHAMTLETLSHFDSDSQLETFKRSATLCNFKLRFCAESISVIGALGHIASYVKESAQYALLAYRTSSDEKIIDSIFCLGEIKISMENAISKPSLCLEWIIQECRCQVLEKSITIGRPWFSRHLAGEFQTVMSFEANLSKCTFLHKSYSDDVHLSASSKTLCLPFDFRIEINLWPLNGNKYLTLELSAVHFYASKLGILAFQDLSNSFKDSVNNQILSRLPKIPKWSLFDVNYLDDFRRSPGLDVTGTCNPKFCVTNIETSVDQQGYMLIEWTYSDPQTVECIMIKIDSGLEVEQGIKVEHFNGSWQGASEGCSLAPNGDLHISTSLRSSARWKLVIPMFEHPNDFLPYLFVWSKRTPSVNVAQPDLSITARVHFFRIMLLSDGWYKNLRRVIEEDSITNVLVSGEFENVRIFFDKDLRGNASASLYGRLSLDCTDLADRGCVKVLTPTDFGFHYLRTEESASLKSYAAKSQPIDCGIHAGRTKYNLKLAFLQPLVFKMGISMHHHLKTVVRMLTDHEFDSRPFRIANLSSISLIVKEEGTEDSKRFIVSQNEVKELHLQEGSAFVSLGVKDGDIEWSPPLDMMGQGYSSLRLSSLGYFFRAKVTKDPFQWSIEVTGGSRVSNQTGANLVLLPCCGEPKCVQLRPGENYDCCLHVLRFRVLTRAGWSRVIDSSIGFQIIHHDETFSFDVNPGPHSLPRVPLLFGDPETSPNGYTQYTVSTPVALTNQWHVPLNIVDGFGQIHAAVQGITVPLYVEEQGGEVAKISFLPPENMNKGRESNVSILCPAFGSGEVPSKDLFGVCVPRPGSSIRFDVPALEKQVSSFPVLLTSKIGLDGRLVLSVTPEILLSNQTPVEIALTAGNVKYIAPSKSEIGIQAHDGIFKIWCFLQRTGQQFTCEEFDILISQQRVIDLFNSNASQVLRMFLEIDREDSFCRVLFKPFYYLSNKTEFIIKNDIDRCEQNQIGSPILGPIDRDNNSLMIQYGKRKSNGGLILTSVARINFVDSSLTGGLEGVRMSIFERSSFKHIVFYRAEDTIHFTNSTDVDIEVDVIDGEGQSVRSNVLLSGQQLNLCLHSKEHALLLRWNSNIEKLSFSDIRSRRQFPLPEQLFLEIQSNNLNLVTRAGLSSLIEVDASASDFAFELCDDKLRFPDTEHAKIGLKVEGFRFSFAEEEESKTTVVCDQVDFYAKINGSRRSILVFEPDHDSGLHLQARVHRTESRTTLCDGRARLSTATVLINDDVLRLLLFFRQSISTAGSESGQIANFSFEEDVEEFLASSFVFDNVTFEPINLVCDIHLSKSAFLPMSLHANRAAIQISELKIENETSLPECLQLLKLNAYDGIILSAPIAVGSLQLLFDPVGLIRSVRKGVVDLVQLPMAGIQQGSLSTFFTGLGQGSVSLVKEVSTWSVSSVVGFSKAISSIILSMDENITTVQASRYFRRPKESLRSRSIIFGRSIIWMKEFDEFVGERAMLYTNLEDARVMLRADIDVCLSISQPVLLLLSRNLIVFAHMGRTPSFAIPISSSFDEDQKEACVRITTERCISFTDMSRARMAEISLAFGKADFEIFQSTVRRLKSGT